MATAMQRQINASTGVNRASTRAIRTKNMKNAMRRVSRGGKGG